MKWRIVGSGQKSEVIIVPFAPASIRAEYFRYPDFTSHQHKSGPAALKSVELLWVSALLLPWALGSLGMQEATVCLSLQNLLSLLLQPPLCTRNGEVLLVLGFDCFLQFEGLSHGTLFTDT